MLPSERKQFSSCGRWESEEQSIQESAVAEFPAPTGRDVRAGCAAVRDAEFGASQRSKRNEGQSSHKERTGLERSCLWSKRFKQG